MFSQFTVNAVFSSFSRLNYVLSCILDDMEWIDMSITLNGLCYDHPALNIQQFTGNWLIVNR